MVKKRLKTSRWDTADYLNTPGQIAGYLEAVLEDGDSSLITLALGHVARSKGMARVARRAGMGRESLYKALSKGGNPQFSTVLKVIEALGLQLRAVPKPSRSRPKKHPASASPKLATASIRAQARSAVRRSP